MVTTRELRDEASIHIRVENSDAEDTAGTFEFRSVLRAPAGSSCGDVVRLGRENRTVNVQRPLRKLPPT